ncbi:MAG: hydrogenase-1 expression HyaE [Gammaproteobacteria bacterium]|nr:hydrogenase-1 expression HyaE [Gammaproteobacteria bacterium]MDH5239519.1 hydrogenase-1 expression HyaE [Gammaproteobacteria bacterium]MDH5260135.1 hydrogenase-1 expression HyaE [Gammaproteobacteria bacterium]MDH5584227.1 hydrogenase-1 expression HyaE [Gammaproteobacteria bacterium]
MTHALIDRLMTELGYPEISLENHDAFIQQPGLNVLFFPGDPDTVKDATDVAVVLPELVAAFENRLNPGIVADTFGAGMKLKRQYGFTHYPSLVFVRDGEYVGTITRIQDWGDYLAKISAMFTAPVRRAPGFSVPVVAG